MSESGVQLCFDFDMAADESAVPREQIAAPEDGSLLEEMEEPAETAGTAGIAVIAGTAETADSEESYEQEPQLPVKEDKMTRRDLQRASLAWLASQNPTAAAIRVPTRLARFRTDAAAFWSNPRKRKLLQPELTVLVEGRLTRDECWPQCSDSAKILPSYREYQQLKNDLEAEIRRTEPQLLDSDVLFPEVEIWEYEKTGNPRYAECLQKLIDFEKALYCGSRFERIRSGQVANKLYLAVPEGTLDPNEIANGWGLLEVAPDLSVRLVKEAEHLPCPDENMLHLSQNIAASSLRDVLFAHGIYMEQDGSVSLRRPPKMRPRLPIHL